MTLEQIILNKHGSLRKFALTLPTIKPNTNFYHKLKVGNWTLLEIQEILIALEEDFNNIEDFVSYDYLRMLANRVKVLVKDDFTWCMYCNGTGLDAGQEMCKACKCTGVDKKESPEKYNERLLILYRNE